MRRRAFAAAFLSLVLAAPPAAAYTKGAGRSDQAPGQEKAMDNCDAKILDQTRRLLVAGGGPKQATEESAEVPTNCDHFWQVDGYIGNS